MDFLHYLAYPVRIGMRKLVLTKVLSEILVFD